ncbi:MAG TPA: glycine--tRNA ligase subunit beta [Gammaproteobacteria bacterium]|nr:glycine--tRNA ligase subunit beta [Gammaproteobacteria bacterium]
MQQKSNEDFLIEIHTEELPPKALRYLAENFLEEIKTRLDKLELRYRDAEFFATPRRLAVLIKKLAAKQADTAIERKGPAILAAFDKEGNPTPACIGFAKSCGVTPKELIQIKTAQGSWMGYQQIVLGKTVQELLPLQVEQALAALPIPKRMRWGAGSVEFVRPVQSVMMLYGNNIIDAEILGCRTNRLTRGHRFHSKGWVSIANPLRYVKTLERKYVIADFVKRKEMIRKAATESISLLNKNLQLVIDENVLDEVTGLVEWPIAIVGRFDETFLKIPSEALIAAMQDHQRYFPVTDQNKKLMPYFVTISNIQSRDVNNVIAGNERVLRARLADAAFFFEMDKKRKLIDRVEDLKNIIFQAKLGTLYQKSERVAHLAKYIAQKIQIDEEKAKRAGLLAKTDLTTQMVGEFPELQGVMGYYYARHDGEGAAVAEALKEQYLPRFSGDSLPETSLGCVLALADRIDTLVGIFGINQIPTGDKDPFALRRAALGILRILIEKKLNLGLLKLISSAAEQYEKLENQNVIKQVINFIFERLKPWYQDQGISADVLASVAALDISNPYDFHLRIQAVQKFKNLPEAESLSIANKRVSNILAKSETGTSEQTINEKLFEHTAEHVLLKKLSEKQQVVSAFSANGNYTEVLAELAGLRDPVDDFFEHVMVMSEDKQRRENRLLLLKKLRNLFLNVADIALLQ